MGQGILGFLQGIVFVVVMQDVRGRGDSDGEWVPMFNEGLDGYDTVRIPVLFAA